MSAAVVAGKVATRGLAQPTVHVPEQVTQQQLPVTLVVRDQNWNPGSPGSTSELVAIPPITRKCHTPRQNIHLGPLARAHNRLVMSLRGHKIYPEVEMLPPALKYRGLMAAQNRPISGPCPSHPKT